MVPTGEEGKKVADMVPLHVSHVSSLYKRIAESCEADTWRGGGDMLWRHVVSESGAGHMKGGAWRQGLGCLILYIY